LHEPVLIEEVLDRLNLEAGASVVDGTLGSGGHAEAILKAIGQNGLLVGLDQDPEAITRAQARLATFQKNVIFRQTSFLYLKETLESLNISNISAVLLDIGISSEDLEDPSRGFSFKLDGPLDMRMDQGNETTAASLLHSLKEEELASIFFRLGEERYNRRIARVIVEERRKAPLETTHQLAKLVESAVPQRVRHGRTHAATRVFQALRIAVNDELGVLERTLPNAFAVLKPGGRLAVISFHSLEDRIVKRFFLERQRNNEGIIITKKPVVATEAEVERNSRSRSAKLRVIERK
jgi:16S rRNA (cytosine1402-N4)-methyltransferase